MATTPTETTTEPAAPDPNLAHRTHDFAPGDELAKPYQASDAGEGHPNAADKPIEERPVGAEADAAQAYQGEKIATVGPDGNTVFVDKSELAPTAPEPEDPTA